MSPSMVSMPLDSTSVTISTTIMDAIAAGSKIGIPKWKGVTSSIRDADLTSAKLTSPIAAATP